MKRSRREAHYSTETIRLEAYGLGAETRMDHNDAVRLMAVEKYFLKELEPPVKEEFEEHYFSCEVCAEEVLTISALVEHGGPELRSAVETPFAIAPVARPRQPRPERRDWFGWLRPAFAVPVFALLLGIVAFQNLVQVPAMQRSLVAMNAPQVLPSAYLASGVSRGGSERVVVAKPGQPYLLFVDIPIGVAGPFTAELYDSSGTKRWTVKIPDGAEKDSLSVLAPGGDEAEGTYTLVVNSVNQPGGTEAGRYSFRLKRP